MIPKRMFRAYDAQKNRGNLFVLGRKDGPGGKVFWRPDSEELEPVSIDLDDADIDIDHLEDVEWHPWVELFKILTIYNEIPIEEGTESLSIVQVSMDASPSMKAK